jgi:hypothetical protein
MQAGRIAARALCVAAEQRLRQLGRCGRLRRHRLCRRCDPWSGCPATAFDAFVARALIAREDGIGDGRLVEEMTGSAAPVGGER